MKISKNSVIMAASFLMVASQAHAQVSAQKGVSLFEAYQSLKAAENAEPQVAPSLMATSSSDLRVAMGQFEVVDAYPLQENGVSLIKVRLQQKDQYPAGSRSSVTKAIVFTLDMLQAGGAAYGVIKTSPKRDKLKHGFAGYAAASFTHGCLELILPNNLRYRRLISVLSGVGASIIAGVGKEYYDSLGYGNVETLDAVATVGGGAGGGVSGGFASAITSAAVGGLLSSLTLTIDADRAIEKIKKRRRQPQPF
jgi:hypothetical protein